MADNDDNDERSSKRTTMEMTSRDVHIHVLELVIPAEWHLETPKVWTKNRDSSEIFTAEVDGCVLRVEYKKDQWHGLIDYGGRLKRVEPAPQIADVARALVKLLDKKK